MATFSFIARHNNEPISKAFTTEWTVAGDATARTITLPLYNSGVFNCTIDWGDGSATSTVTAYNDGDRVHTYASNGTYQVKIIGECPAWSFNNTGDKLKITDIIHWGTSDVFGGFSYLTGGFYGCTNLKTTGKGKIVAKAGLTTCSQLFRNCTTITRITPKMFDNCTNLTASAYYYAFASVPLTETPDVNLFKYSTLASTSAFEACFSGALFTYIGEIFKYNTLVSSNAFKACFSTCTNLTDYHEDIFRYCTSASSGAFYEVFYNAGVTTIKAGTFKYNTAVTSDAFRSAYILSDLTTIETDAFRYNVNTTTNAFRQIFQDCILLESVPQGLLKYNTGVTGTGFYGVFYGCIKLQANQFIFYADGEQATRFLNQSHNFGLFMSRASFTGTQGVAPDLWNCNFGTGTLTSAGCYAGAGNSLTSLSNYADIPAGWK